MVTYYRDDYEYDRQQEAVARARTTIAEWEAGLTKEDCPYCICGQVPVPDRSIAPALAICGLCNGRGWIAKL
jgi:hypothetical protein